MIKQWSDRSTRGEWFYFDYSAAADKADFNEGLRKVFDFQTKEKWHYLSESETREALNAGFKDWEAKAAAFVAKGKADIDRCLTAGLRNV